MEQRAETIEKCYWLIFLCFYLVMKCVSSMKICIIYSKHSICACILNMCLTVHSSWTVGQVKILEKKKIHILDGKTDEKDTCRDFVHFDLSAAQRVQMPVTTGNTSVLVFCVLSTSTDLRIKRVCLSELFLQSFILDTSITYLN